MTQVEDEVAGSSVNAGTSSANHATGNDGPLEKMDGVDGAPGIREDLTMSDPESDECDDEFPSARQSHIPHEYIEMDVD